MRGHTANPSALRGRLGCGLAALLLGCLRLAPALAGDPVGVNQVLEGIRSNWPDASFSVDVLGLTDSAAVTGGALQVQYEAAGPGYLTVLRVSSHGDITGLRAAAAGPGAGGQLTLPIRPPLGDEAAIFLFSQQPLTGLNLGTAEAPLGSDRPHADALLQQLKQLQAQGIVLAARQFHYLVEAPPGQTQYTTRSIMRRMEAATKVPIPARIEFDFDSAQLTMASRHDLDVFGAAMVARLHKGRVTLEGHTDMIGTPRYNLDLSVRRAAAARLYLLESFGLGPSQLRVTGKGTAGPVATNDTEEGRSQNRRVDFIFETH
jgi:outer membrane protein OmpA-like peptidoglycan-associated protein